MTRKTWNPLRRTQPPGWSGPVNLFEFLWYQADYYGRTGHNNPYSQHWRGFWNMFRMLLPSRYVDEDGTWRILGPRWQTRTCDESEEWSLFMIQHTKPEGEWTIEGLRR